MLYSWVVFAHLIGVFGFLLAHGVSVVVALRLRRAPGPVAMGVLLDAAAATRPLMYGSLALLLGAGVLAGFMGHWWGQGWIWVAAAVLVAVTVAAVALGPPYFRRLREAAARAHGAAGSPAPAPSGAELDALLASPRPLLIGAVGVAGLLIILWLMVLKPF